MSFNIKNSFVSRAIVEDNKQVDAEENKESDEVVIQEQYDPRTLFERLQEQKTLKEEKFAEESRLSNQIKRVDEEEAEFFRILSDEKEKLEYERKIKEQLELEEYRLAVEARAAPVGPAVTTANAVASSSKQKPVIKSNKLSKQSIKGALFVKKKKRESDSEEEEEEEEPVKPTAKKQKTSLSLLADYGDINSDSDSDA
ncbi:hypothetical protein INT48_008173 [Thamnidium elegans]|uniref:FAM192A/Fyv6 N-terminal domain-containing protein n=1 Tax=Thamnidium elegans TaxID=101142 RepID=A0A8H7ST59_9FUNG|nr:hypothetical protein INT48_008173 [Thamnidium elegans]